ncbi:MAG: hypothetical protein AABM64_06615 [Pseudomonadota bacterium]
MISGLGSGDFSNLKVRRGVLLEYANTPLPLALVFEFNPAAISRTRSVTVRTGGAPGTRGGYDFSNVREVARASQGVSVNAESFSVKILLDATDRMNAGDPIAARLGVQPELDTLRSMVEPKSQTPDGARTLAALGEGDERAFARHEYASVLLFVWGVHVLPVFLTQVQIEAKDYLPSLLPYRAEASLTLQIIESNNPFYQAELKRQFALAGSALGAIGSLASALLG